MVSSLIPALVQRLSTPVNHYCGKLFPATALGAVQRSENGAISLALGGFYFRSVDERRRFLFFKWGSQKVNFWTGAQRMTLNTEFYARRRADVLARLEADAPNFIANLKLGSR
ncbi:MAG: hypothetical protein FJ147_23665 [Deltaproteobacteria bacterium]|nr:hypothetical protein [Deltaproteobacteria bacterium]